MPNFKGFQEKRKATFPAQGRGEYHVWFSRFSHFSTFESHFHSMPKLPTTILKLVCGFSSIKPTSNFGFFDLKSVTKNPPFLLQKPIKLQQKIRELKFKNENGGENKKKKENVYTKFERALVRLAKEKLRWHDSFRENFNLMSIPNIRTKGIIGFEGRLFNFPPKRCWDPPRLFKGAKKILPGYWDPLRLSTLSRRSLSDVVDYPRYFSYPLEKKTMPRYWVLKGQNIECSLQKY
ncbi:Transcription termination factor, mitochondrial/chloroplastic [Dillenia turbinata]|uniref:Transcription termination factor, mitochondrial/chloroplastic n=1 Tax=Dillenia turbinata TaxID=194707 RepID=A0AAN8YSE3_9MAGN